MQQKFQDFDKTIQKNKQSTKLTYILQHILMLIDKLSNKANKDIIKMIYQILRYYL